MKFKLYQELAKRTRASLATSDLDVLHMIIGMTSELNELDEAIEKNDYVNIGEELGDILWYLFNYAELKSFEMLDYEIENKVLNPILPYSQEIVDKMFILLTNQISKLNNLEKRRIVYKKDIERMDFMDSFSSILHSVMEIFDYYNLNIKKYLVKNINKLKVRFPEKFTEGNAINRNLDEERKKLESEQ